MIVNLNDTLVNLDNVCHMERRYQMTADPMIPGIMKDRFRISIAFVDGKTNTVYFDSRQDLDNAYDQIQLLARVL